MQGKAGETEHLLPHNVRRRLVPPS